MTIAQSLLTEFDEEMALTRKALERVPSDKGSWKPHEKSFPLGHLAQLISRMPSWLALIVKQPELDINPPAGERRFPGYSLETTETLLTGFDDGVEQARDALARTQDGDMSVPWRLKAGGHVVMDTTRIGMIRNTLNHIIHHRGQLTVYLRLIDVPVPSLYGPSADEKF